MTYFPTDDPACAEAWRIHECDRLESIGIDPEQSLLAEDAFRIADRAIDECFGKDKPKKATRMKRIMRMYILEEQTLDEVGAEFEIGRERVRQIFEQARSVVRRYMQRMDSLEASV